MQQSQLKQKDFETFRTDMDSWVKTLTRQISSYNHMPIMLEEHAQNIDHNYELIHEMRAEINKLRDEISALRIVQLLHLKADAKAMNKIE